MYSHTHNGKYHWARISLFYYLYRKNTGTVDYMTLLRMKYFMFYLLFYQRITNFCSQNGIWSPLYFKTP